MCLEGFRGARAAAARMCPACHFLQGMVALAGAKTLLKQVEVSATVALEAPFDGNVEKPMGFGRDCGPGRRANVIEGVRGARESCPRSPV